MKIRSLAMILCTCLIIGLSGCSNNHENTSQQSSIEKKLEEADQLEVAGKEEESYKVYQSILSDDENNPAAYAGIAYLYGKLGNFDKAVEFIKLAEKNLPGNLNPNQIAGTYHIMADIYDASWIYEGDKWEQAAMEAYKKAAEVPDISENNKVYYTYQAYVHIVDILQSHSDKESIQACIQGTQVLLESDEANAEHYAYRLADLYGQLGEFEKAREYIDSLNPVNEEGRIDLIFSNAKYYCYKGEYEKAKEYIEQLNEQNCKNQKEKYLLLKAFYGSKIGDNEAVKDNIEKLLDVSITKLNLGIVQTILSESGVTIDPSYEIALEKEKEEKYAIVLGQ